MCYTGNSDVSITMIRCCARGKFESCVIQQGNYYSGTDRNWKICRAKIVEVDCAKSLRNPIFILENQTNDFNLSIVEYEQNLNTADLARVQVGSCVFTSIYRNGGICF